MIQTAEQILESVRALPPVERQKFFDLAEAENLRKGRYWLDILYF